MKLNKLVNVIDCEATCWLAPGEQPKNQISEIIEIGLAVVDITTMKIVENDTILVKPQYSTISEFCTELTTLTQEQVDQGISFPEACQKLKQFFKSKDRTFISWGDYDRKMFERNCETWYINYPFGPRHLNLKNSFALLHGLDHELGMDAALSMLGLKLEGIHHRGIDDAKNIANIFTHMLQTFRQ